MLHCCLLGESGSAPGCSGIAAGLQKGVMGGSENADRYGLIGLGLLAPLLTAHLGAALA